MNKILLLIATCIIAYSCNSEKGPQEKALLAKENELLKKENELLKKEKSLDSINNFIDNSENTSSTNFEYMTYYNSERQYKIKYPSFLTMGSAPQNGDGREFINDGGEIRLWVFSSYYTDLPINELYNQNMKFQDYVITYKVIKSDWYVVSGIDNENGKLFYSKVYYSPLQGGQYRTFILEYPQTKQKSFDKIIPIILKSFTDI